MWWMCNNNNPAGGANGASNLRSGYQDYHAIYLASIAWAFKNWAPALTFNSVEAFNEPSSGYWNSQGSQEGCDFDRPTMSTVMTDLRQELNNRGMGSTIVAGADETSYIEAAQTLEQIGSVTMSRVNVHGYETSDAGTDRTRLYNDAVARGLPIWNTEYGEGDTTGLSLIANLNRDFQYLHMSAWCYWLPFDGSGWGLINADNGNWVLGNANTKYFVLAHYTRHIRPGDYILATSSPDVVSAYDNTNHKLIIVCCNWATSGLNITFNLSQYNNVSGPISRWTTLCHGGANYVPDGGFSGPSGKSFTAYFMPSAISTFEINNVW
jgi:galactan endo-1,6-beta-galactosidase